MVEFSKIEKVDLKTIRVSRSTVSPLRVKIESLQAGEAIVVTGIERENIESAEAMLKHDGRKFTNIKLDVLKYRVVRIK